MSDQDPFQTTPQTSTPEATPPSAPADPFVDKLSGITNEHGEPKYKDVETALDALKASQQFIEQLKKENAEQTRIREEREAELAKLGSIEDFVNRIKPAAPTNEPVVTPPASTGLSEEDVAKLLQKQLEQRDAQSQQEKNLTEVTQRLSELHGDKSSAVIQSRAKELGTTPSGLRQLASTNPAMALELLGAKSSTPTPAPSQSSVHLPHTPKDDNPMPVFEKSTTRGGLTSKEMAERFRKSREYTNKRIGVEDATNN